MDFYSSRNPESLSRITQRIYISNVVTACNVSALVGANIQFVLSCLDYNLPKDVLDNYARVGITQLYLPAYDLEFECLVDAHYERVVGFLSRAEAACALHDSLNAHRDCTSLMCTRSALQPAGILVHCHMGMSRSVTCVAMYLLYKNRCQLRGDIDSVEYVLELIKQGRPITKVNPGFRSQLYCLADRLRKSSSCF